MHSLKLNICENGIALEYSPHTNTYLHFIVRHLFVSATMPRCHNAQVPNMNRSLISYEQRKKKLVQIVKFILFRGACSRINKIYTKVLRNGARYACHYTCNVYKYALWIESNRIGARQHCIRTVTWNNCGGVLQWSIRKFRRRKNNCLHYYRAAAAIQYIRQKGHYLGSSAVLYCPLKPLPMGPHVEH